MAEHYNCCYAYDADMAMQFLDEATEKPDYIFLDINLPRINGKQILLQLKNDDRYTNIPVIIYTTQKQQKQLEEFYSLGAKSCIVKPTAFHDLKRAIREAIGAKQTKRVRREKQ
jgi:DNA-binding response OmpR family regulator